MRATLLRFSGAAFLGAMLLALPSCEEAKKVDWKNREIAWKYGPTTGAASSIHLTGTGKKGKGPIAKGWKMHLKDGKELTIKPYKLSDEHALFGKSKLIIGLFNKAGDEIHKVRSEAITKDTASFSFDLTKAQAKPIWDAIIWFAKI